MKIGQLLKTVATQLATSVLTKVTVIKPSSLVTGLVLCPPQNIRKPLATQNINLSYVDKISGNLVWGSILVWGSNPVWGSILYSKTFQGQCFNELRSLSFALSIVVINETLRCELSDTTLSFNKSQIEISRRSAVFISIFPAFQELPEFCSICCKSNGISGNGNGITPG